MNKRPVVVLICLFLVVLLSTGLTTAQENNEYWEGQKIVLDQDIEPDSIYAISNESGDNYIREIKSNSTGYLTIDTSEFGSGEFEVQSRRGNIVATYTVINDNFTVTPRTALALDDTTEYTIESNQSSFDLTIKSDSLDRSELDSIISPIYKNTGLTESGVYIEDLSSNNKIQFNTSEIDDGNYNLDWSVNNTVGSAQTTLINDKVSDKYLNFTRDSYSGSRGDNINIDLNMRGLNRATLEFQSGGYQHDVTVFDTDNNGKATVSFNTQTAGKRLRPVEGLEGTDVTQGRDSSVGDEYIDFGSYRIDLSVDGDRIDSSSMLITRPEIRDLSVRTLRKSQNISDISNISKSKASENVAQGDYAIVSINGSGIHGDLDNIVSDTNEIRDLGIELQITERFGQINRRLGEVNADSAEIIYSDDDNDTLFFVFKSSNLPNADRDLTTRSYLNSYSVTFTLDSDTNQLFDHNIALSDTLNLTAYDLTPVERRTDNNRFIVRNETRQIAFSTSIANNTNITLNADYRDDKNTKQNMRIKDGQIKYDISNNLSIYDEFTVQIPETDQSYNYIVGSNNIIESVDIPDSQEIGTKFNISVDTYENISDYQINTQIASNVLVERQGMYKVPKGVEPGEYSIQITAEDEDGILTEEQTRNITLTENKSKENLRPDIQTVEYTIPDTVKIRTDFVPTILLENNGNTTGTKTVRLLVNDETVDEEEITIQQNERKTIKFNWTPQEVGNKNIVISTGDNIYSQDVNVRPDSVSVQQKIDDIMNRILDGFRFEE